ncbi:hypothetical protein [Gaoshiqia sp. Z1-71]|uniref:hypothetical protein n=1 Tax=Gaoshiqia hydrogeniformans TaxID=3290090 RepID=UPI003BF860A4
MADLTATSLMILAFMRTIQALLFLAIYLLYSCNNNTEPPEHKMIVLVDSLIIDNYHIDKLPEIFENRQLFLNKERIEIVMRNIVNRQIQTYNFSHILSHILSLKVFNDSMLFIDGIPNFIILNLHSKEYEVVFKNMDMTSNPILNNGEIYIAGINLELDTPLFSMNVLDYFEQQILPTSICEIEPKKEVEDFLLTGHLIQTKNRLIFIYDWIGEYYILDKTKEFILKNDFLPLMGNNKKFINKAMINNPAIYQAYSADVYEDSLIFILREVDFETVDPESPDEESVISTLRKRIHVFNEDMELKSSFLLPNKATQIKIIGNYLYTLHHKDNKIYFYEIQI